MSTDSATADTSHDNRDAYTWAAAARDLALLTRLTADEAYELVHPLRETLLPPWQMTPLLVALIQGGPPWQVPGHAIVAVTRLHSILPATAATAAAAYAGELLAAAEMMRQEHAAGELAEFWRGVADWLEVTAGVDALLHKPLGTYPSAAEEKRLTAALAVARRYRKGL